MMKFKNYLIMFITLLGVWLLLNNSMKFEIVMVGLALSLILPLLFCGRCEVFTQLKLTPKSMLYTILYLLVFLKELVVANFDVARRVISPKLPINPGIVEVKTTLKSKIARVVLANSITLTPGTFTLEIVEDTLFVHWIDVKSTDVKGATKMIVATFEKYLEEMYG